jgi:GxxExxY protein
VLLHEQITERVLGAAIEVHGTLGPGLLESAYEECLAHEFRLRKIEFQKQVALPLSYKGILLDCGYRMDFVVEDAVVVELKCVERILPIHEAQLLTYLRLSRKRVGLLLNFNEPVLRDGIVRRIL